MGTPGTQKDKHVNNTPPLTELDFREKLRLLMEASQQRPQATYDLLYSLLESTKTLLMPLVQWFDKPIPQLFSTITDDCAALQSHRAMLVHDRWGGEDAISVALDRRGQWFVKMHNAPGPSVTKMKSGTLAAGMLKRLDGAVFQNAEFKKAWEDQTDQDDWLPLLTILRFQAILQFGHECHTIMTKALEDPLQRIRIMQGRLEVLHTYLQALDPLGRQSEVRQLPGYAIWHEHKRGTDVTVQPYLHCDALKPFWNLIRDWRKTEDDKYYEKETSHSFRSLKNFVQYVRDLFVGAYAGDQSRDPFSCLHSSGRRLPLTGEEVAILRSFVQSIE